jgi:hypothetical protein
MTEEDEAFNDMTLRDYFAAKALQGICARGTEPSWTNARLATEAYDLANAMMKARNSIWLRPNRERES